jgi:hypothetical protein
MRATVALPHLKASPGRSFTITVDVVNSNDVIDGASARLVGLPGTRVSCDRGELALFPAGTGTLVLTVDLPRGFLAGLHQATVEVLSRVYGDQVARCDIDVDVEPVTQGALQLLPATKSGHRRSSFTLVCDNEGNTPLELTLDGYDPERALRLHFEPAVLEVPPATTAEVVLKVRAGRQVLGSERPRPIMVVGTGSGLELDAKATYVQKPTIPRGVVTAAILAVIIGLWAAAFAVGIHKVLAEDPPTKSAPLSFFAVTPSGAAKLAAATSQDTPTGFIPKNEAPLGIGGTITGTVVTPGLPSGVGRITVQAIRVGDTSGDAVTAATQADGTYQLAGLFPGTYDVSFSAPGYQTVWYAGSHSQGSAKAVLVSAQIETPNINATITGQPATIQGHLLTGETPAPPVTVTVLQNNVPVGASVTSNSSGDYSVSGLASPATYTLAFTAKGFQQTDATVTVGGGQTVVANTVQMSAGAGEIDGTITDGTNPLGGVAVVATANGQTFTSASPTTGQVGHFALPNLPTPATYLLTFSDKGFGTQTVAVNLGPGQILANLQVAMVGGTGTISGMVTSSAGSALGGVTVTVGGASVPATTQTLTAGTVGAYSLSGLTTPGNYTVTFSLPGYASQTVGVSLDSNGLASAVNVTLTPVLCQLTGTVSNSSGTSLMGVAVSLTSGTAVHSTSTASIPAGSYGFTGLPAGTYSVTFSLSGYQNQTALVTLQAGQASVQNITLVASS